MKLESPVTPLQKPAAEVFSKLSVAGNFEKLMPDNVAKFEVSGENTFVFALKGMPEIALKLREQHPPETIIYEAAEGKVPFTLTIYIRETAPGTSTVQFIFNGEFNAMMGMMIKSPIRNFIGVLSENSVKL